MYYQIISTPIGPYLIVDSGAGISVVEHFEQQTPKRKRALEQMENKETSIIQAAILQLEEYFAGDRKTFDLPLDEQGTPFQKQVWQALRAIPYGETRSYKEIAAAIDNPKAVRAVGLANNRNPICLFTPCHRVIGSDGSMTGYGGGMDAKIYLLKLEK